MSGSKTSTAPPDSAGPLARHSHVALYRQIAQRLEEAISHGRYAVLDRIDTEHELMARFGVSRITVRQAVAELVRKGLVVRKQGKGSFIAGPSIRHDLHDMRGFVDVFLSQGQRSETRLLSFAPVDPPDDVAAALKLSPEAKPMQLQRLYVLDSKPVAVAQAWLTPQANSVTWKDAERHPTYAILQQLLGLRIARSEMAIRSRVAGRPLSKLLQVSPSAPILLLIRTSFDTAGSAQEVTHFAVNSEAYEFTLSGQGPLPIGPSLKATAD